VVAVIRSLHAHSASKEVNRVNIETVGQPLEPASAILKGT
jgi:hypothetical protein